MEVTFKEYNVIFILNKNNIVGTERLKFEHMDRNLIITRTRTVDVSDKSDRVAVFEVSKQIIKSS